MSNVGSCIQTGRWSSVHSHTDFFAHIIRIPTVGWMTIPHVICFDSGTDSAKCNMFLLPIVNDSDLFLIKSDQQWMGYWSIWSLPSSSGGPYQLKQIWTTSKTVHNYITSLELCLNQIEPLVNLYKLIISLISAHVTHVRCAKHVASGEPVQVSFAWRKAAAVPFCSMRGGEPVRRQWPISWWGSLKMGYITSNNDWKKER